MAVGAVGWSGKVDGIGGVRTYMDTPFLER